MSIELGDVENIAHLARLDLTEKEKEEAASSMSNILNLIDQMQSVNTDDVAPLAHAFDTAQRLREDKSQAGTRNINTRTHGSKTKRRSGRKRKM